VSIVGDITPKVDTPSNVTIFSNETLTLSWNLTDNGNSSHVTFFENASVVNEFNFTKFYIFNYTITTYPAGTYNLTISVYDELNQTRTTTMFVVVNTPPPPPPPPTTETTPTSTQTSTVSTSSDSVTTQVVTQTATAQDPINSLIGSLPLSMMSILSGMLMMSVFITMYRRRK